MHSKDNIIAASIFVIAVIFFLSWGYKEIYSAHLILFILATAFGLFMAFNIGGNDVANSFGTSVGAKTLTIKQALVVAAIFELSGAVFAGADVTQTIRSQIVRFPANSLDPMHFVIIMMSALCSSGLWLLIATKRGLPVSTTHSIVGGIVGAALTMGFKNMSVGSALSMVSWQEIGKIVFSWIISPIMGGVISYIIYSYIKKRILQPSRIEAKRLKALKRKRKNFKENYVKELATKPIDEQVKILKIMAVLDEDDIDGEASEYKTSIKAMKEKEKSISTTIHLRKHLPIVSAFAAIIISAMLLFKGLQNIHLGLGSLGIMWILFVIGAVAYISCLTIIRVMIKSEATMKNVNRIFSWLQIFTASAFAFSHGANDIANAVGPFAAILDVLKSGQINPSSPVPGIAMVTFGISLIVGLWFLGRGVIATVGSKLASILPTTGFSAELAASTVILFATRLGIPVSSTHILIGAVLGIGVLNKDANWSMMKPIGLAWIITLPVAAISSSIIYLILEYITGL